MKGAGEYNHNFPNARPEVARVINACATPIVGGMNYDIEAVAEALVILAKLKGFDWFSLQGNLHLDWERLKITHNEQGGVA